MEFFFASQVVIQDWSGFAGIRLNGINNVLIDGRAGNPLNGTTYGILLHCASMTSCDGIDDGATNNSYTIQNVEVYGPPCVPAQSCTDNGASGINLPYGGSGFTYHNVYVHQWGDRHCARPTGSTSPSRIPLFAAPTTTISSMKTSFTTMAATPPSTT